MNLLSRIERFLHRSAMPQTLFGRHVAKDPRLVGDLRNGRQPGQRMCERIEAFLAEREHD
ncbi:hypothetical protein [Sphingomonas sp. 37zxx]|uniref:hypothetical protein n=1 Tax=Sphingomonas sp. 37zxx TaxID=1550073 RepID=UPI00053BF4FE|nr:hypothetical protein [Sphingomonas sp. 37zxx]